MSRTLVAAVAVLAAIGTGRAPAQQPEATLQPVSHGIFWSFDPIHGVMQGIPLASFAVPGKLSTVEFADASTPTKTYTGTIDITFTVNLISTLPKNAVLRCSGAVGLEYETETMSGQVTLISLIGNGNTAESVDATVSQTTATCKFKVPYAWTLPASTSTTKVTVQGVTGSVGVAADQLDAEGVVIRTYRSTSVQLPGIVAIPQDGITTSLTASTVL
jgi:hypothetical protein